ncbi:hypothetical protein AG0111_0g11736 [Alternaria gaisen]|uniref:Uncharacterized protein n=1 Tax=Alternaria gaisen TaxID=167740 RepID=A0ACB6F6S2_9PLEO|nr:hypothetical protein AG0111_0g11736 [Alternaria gaisen]
MSLFFSWGHTKREAEEVITLDQRIVEQGTESKGFSHEKSIV